MFGVELTDAEYQRALDLEQEAAVLGNIEETERTYVEVRSLSSILSERLVDWSNVGMIMETLYRRDNPGIAE